MIEKNKDAHSVSKKLIAEIGEAGVRRISLSLMQSIHELLLEQVESGHVTTSEERETYVREFVQMFSCVFFKDLLGFKEKKSKSKSKIIELNPLSCR